MPSDMQQHHSECFGGGFFFFFFPFLGQPVLKDYKIPSSYITIGGDFRFPCTEKRGALRLTEIQKVGTEQQTIGIPTLGQKSDETLPSSHKLLSSPRTSPSSQHDCQRPQNLKSTTLPYSGHTSSALPSLTPFPMRPTPTYPVPFTNTSTLTSNQPYRLMNSPIPRNTSATTLYVIRNAGAL